MNTEQLRELLRQDEGLKHDFKREIYAIYHADNEVKRWQWNEFIKDILALTNGNVGVADKWGYLVIGAENNKQPDGTRNLRDVGDLQLKPKDILDKVNAICHPPVPDIDCETVVMEGVRLLLISIRPSPHLHETTRKIETGRKSNFPENTVFIRRNESVATAGNADRDAIRRDKEVFFTGAQNHVPFYLPQLDTSTFTGRNEEMRKMEDVLFRDSDPTQPRIVGISGGPGIGKSALACHFASVHRQKFPDGVIGLRTDGKDLNNIARDFTRCCGEEIDAEDGRDASAIMQTVFRHRRMLLVFDNAESASIRALRPGGDQCAVIVTTRDRQLPSLIDIAAPSRIDLNPLSDSDSLRFLEQVLGGERVAFERHAAVTITNLVGHLPLALQIVGASLQAQESRLLADYGSSLSKERDRLSKLTVRGDEALDVRASVSLSLKLLLEEELGFFGCLAVCARDGFSVRAASAAGDCDDETASERLHYLHRLSLLNRAGSDRFVFHNLIRLLAEELSDERGFRDAAAARHAQEFVQLVKSTDRNDSAKTGTLVDELDDIVLAAEWLSTSDDFDHEFIKRIEPLFEKTGYWEQAIQVMSKYLISAERQGDWTSAVHFRVQLAKYFSLLGESSRAEEVIATVESDLEKIDSEDARLRCEATWLITLGQNLQRQNRVDEAIAAFRRSTVLKERIRDKRGLAIALRCLGTALSKRGRFTEAAKTLERSIEIGDDLDEEFGEKRHLSIALHSLGTALQHQGRLPQARRALERSYNVLVELGDLRGQVKVLNSLGTILIEQGNYDKAVDVLKTGIDLCERLNDERSLAMSLNTLGVALQRQEQFAEGAINLEHAISLFRQLGDRRSLAMTLNTLGTVFLRQGRIEAALTALEESCSIFRELDDNRGLAQALNSLSTVLQEQGRYDEALNALECSVDIGEVLGDKRHLGIALSSLGTFLNRRKRHSEAMVAFERSYNLFVELEDHRSQAQVQTALGRALVELGHIERGSVELSKAFSIDEALKNRRGIRIISTHLIEALLKLGQRDVALSYSVRALALLPTDRRLLDLHTRISSTPTASVKPAWKSGVIKCVLRHKSGYVYGFIRPIDGGTDIYFSEGQIKSGCLSELADGMSVQVEVEEGPKGPRAKNLKLLI